MIRVEVSVRVHFYDLDPMGIMWHGNYPRLLEQARVALLESVDFSYDVMQLSGYAWPIVDMRLRYVRSIRLAQQLAIEATLAEYENRVRITYRIRDAATGETLTKAETVQLAVEVASGALCFETPPCLVDRVRRAL